MPTRSGRSRPTSEGSKRKRTRTGCLSCRTRRVKCDEGKPTCQRCHAANIHCAGYEEKRELPIKRSRPDPSQTIDEDQDPRPVSRSSEQQSSLFPYPRFREDGLPLIAFPSNPRPYQRPCSAARSVLAFHQFLFRTLPVIFPIEHLDFWRDHLCEFAWEREYLFEAVVALGLIHRASVLLSTSVENDHHRGMDTKVIALQAYTRALQSLSDNMNEAEDSPELLVAVLALLAKFECFIGNLPATIRHLLAAQHYFQDTSIWQGKDLHIYKSALDACLQGLAYTCRRALPVPKLTNSTNVQIALSPSPPPRHSPFPDDPISSYLQSLEELPRGDADLESLIWCPIAAAQQRVSAERIGEFQAGLQSWAKVATTFLPDLNPEIRAKDLMSIDWDELSLPPPPYPDMTPSAAIACATWNFYMARTYWALCLLRKDPEISERWAYYFIYEMMRFVAAATRNQAIPAASIEDEVYLPCETLELGFLPMLYIAGQCSPRPSWLLWIRRQLNRIRQEGLFHGHIFAASLDTLHTFETYNDDNGSPLVLERFASPESRIIATLIPETDGRSYTCYYTRRKANGAENPRPAYYAFGHVRWCRTAADDGVGKPEVHIYEETQLMAEPFTGQWLLGRSPACDWLTWPSGVEFDFDRALRDHIKGGV